MNQLNTNNYNKGLYMANIDEINSKYIPHSEITKDILEISIYVNLEVHNNLNKYIRIVQLNFIK